jgi:hypothetical protein
MGFVFDLLCFLIVAIIFCAVAGAGVAYVFHRVVKKLDLAGYVIIDGKIFNPETNEWEEL